MFRLIISIFLNLVLVQIMLARARARATHRGGPPG